MNPFLMEILEYLAGVALGAFFFFFPEFASMKHITRSFTKLDRVFGKAVGVCIILWSLIRIWGVIADAISTLF